MVASRWGAIALVLLSAFARPVMADDNTSLAQARRDVDSSDYFAARTALVAAINAGTASPQDLADIYRLSGIVEAALGETGSAQASFAKWLALDPKASLPPGTSPKMTRPFDAAKAKKLAPLKIKTESRAEPPRITIVVASDALGLVARGRAIVRVDGGPEKTVEAAGKTKIAIDLPRGKRLDLRVQALDAHGNALIELGSTDVPIVITSEPGKPDVASEPVEPREPPPEPPARPLYLMWYAWAGAAAVCVGFSAYSGFAARSAKNELDQLNATSSMHDFSDAQAVESRARRDTVMFDIGISATFAFAIGAGVTYYMASHGTAETRISAVPLAGGGAIVLGGRF